MNTEELNDSNFLLFCASHYDQYKFTSDEDFLEDLNRIKYIKKLITRYIENNELKERLILNHIIILHNCFGSEILSKILFLKLESQMKYIKPFLILINALPGKLYNINNKEVIYTDSIPMDETIVEKLRRI